MYIFTAVQYRNVTRMPKLDTKVYVPLLTLTFGYCSLNVRFYYVHAVKLNTSITYLNVLEIQLKKYFRL